MTRRAAGPPRGNEGDSDEYYAPDLVLSVRDAKANLSRAIREVKQGKEVVITEYGKPVARLVSIRAQSVEETLADLERLGLVEPPGKPLDRLPRPIKVPEGLVERILEEGKGWPHK